MCTDEQWERQHSSKEVGWNQLPRPGKTERGESNITCWKSNNISIRFQPCDLLVFKEGMIRCKLLREAVDVIHLSFRKFWKNILDIENGVNVELRVVFLSGPEHT